MNPAQARLTSSRDVLQIFFKHKYAILVFSLATIATVVVFNHLATPVYRATAKVIVKFGRENIYLPASADVRPVVTFDREEQLNTEIEIFKSPTLYSRAAREIGFGRFQPQRSDSDDGIIAAFLRKMSSLAPEKSRPGTDPELALAQKLKSAVTVEAVKDSNVIEIGYEHRDPNSAAAHLNTLIRLYLDRHLEVHRAPDTDAFFQHQAGVLQDALRRAEGELNALKKQYGVTDLNEQQSLLLKEIAALQANLFQSVNEKSATAQRAGQLRRALDRTPSRIDLEVETNLNQELISLLEQRLTELQLRQKELSAKYTDANLMVRNVRDEIAMVQAKLATYDTKNYPKKRIGVNLVHQRLLEELLRSDAELKSIIAKLDSQKAQLGDYEARLNALNQIEDELSRLEREAGLHRRNYELYMQRFEESRIGAAMDSEKITSVRLLEAASTPLEPIKPKKMVNLIIGVVAGAVGGLTLALLREWLDDRLEHIEDIEAAFDLPVLATFPELRSL